MLQCWAGMPTDRPTFEALKDFLAETVPVIVRSLEPFDEQGWIWFTRTKLEIKKKIHLEF